MAMRIVMRRGPLTRRLMESTRRTATSTHYFSYGTGRVLGKWNVLLRTSTSRERMEKLKLKPEKEKAAAEKEKGEKSVSTRMMSFEEIKDTAGGTHEKPA